MTTHRDIRIPADSVHAIRRSLYRELGAEAGAQALQEAGYAAGDALFERLERGTSDDPLGSTPSTSFWDRLATAFRELGWGVMRHQALHPGVGALDAADWFELEGTGSACPFTTGALANILGRVAGTDVAVLQAPAGEEPGTARFLFGSAGVLDDLYSGLREGRDLDTAIAGLG
jgi:hypothetical protein